jgi:pimeloyl-ACP methyl ester carboxylesterase
MARDRTVYTIDGPSHGKSEAVHRDFAFEDCVAAAEQALDRLGLAEPVDWVGNAWGGHVGIRLAMGPRLRTLTTIGTPVQAFTLGEKLTTGLAPGRVVPLRWADRVHFEAVVRLAARCGSHCG